jgi:hypothetical protein
MADQDRAGTGTNHEKVPGALRVTPSDETERPQGLAFDVQKGADLSGVPVGDQTPKHPGAGHTEHVVRETGGGVGLAVPGDQDQNADKPSRDEPGQR